MKYAMRVYINKLNILIDAHVSPNICFIRYCHQAINLIMSLLLGTSMVQLVSVYRIVRIPRPKDAIYFLMRSVTFIQYTYDILYEILSSC